MDSNEELICPWCQTEIVWDPEIGPEEECPHCFNELSDYRSIKLTVKQTGQQLLLGEEVEEDEDFAGAWDDDGEPLDSYSETVLRLTSEQEEAPECSTCHELMLHAGDEIQTVDSFLPHITKVVGAPFLKAPFTMNVYVCPACFKVEKYLSDSDRVSMVDRLKKD
ncbi:hypothetical protein [Paenibacillus eucommiae]|uniref:DNA-directed RNA polymerase subunit RPC12/RpoP n=1 Tax=Paenibacillus eucommiae TaxID=1355755 RepID=A0ABS4J119_9BACL|nr:hypothetical protein [Paenibacillus eucommiae]MBP1993515.1 DNA-directed RNA polymerase subunit RPC12/RpoP [Paenibacillus eucommiae]